MEKAPRTKSPPLTLWLARALGVAIALVPFLLAADAFGQGDRSVLVAVLVHAGMAVPLVVALVAGWLRPRAGALLYSLLGILFAIRLIGQGSPIEALIFAMPLFVVAALFFRAGSASPEA